MTAREPQEGLNALLKTTNLLLWKQLAFSIKVYSFILLHTTWSGNESMLSQYPMYNLWKRFPTSAGYGSSLKDSNRSDPKYVLLPLYSLLTNYLPRKIRKTLYFHSPVFPFLRRVVRLRNNYGQPPVKMLAVIIHINFHHCLMSVSMLSSES